MFIYSEYQFIRGKDEYISFTKEMKRQDVKEYIIQCVMLDEVSEENVNDDVERIESGDLFGHRYKNIYATIEYVEVEQ